MDNPKTDSIEPQAPGALRPPGRRPTIGLLHYWIGIPVGDALWAGVESIAREQGANLICFVGKALRCPLGFSAQGNVLYDLVNVEQLDGLIICGGSLGAYVSYEEIRTFCERFHPLPRVSIALPMEGVPSVMMDNYEGMRQAVVHLIEVHGYRRIAFVCGPAGHPEAEERYRAYADTLAEYGIPLDPDLVAPGDYLRPSGVAAIDLLLDQRQADFEAVVTAADEMAIGVIEALQARGIEIPEEIAVISFDDDEDSQYFTIPLTTVRQPAYEQGQQAARMLFALMAGDPVPKQVIQPAELIIRRSCGCLMPAVMEAAVTSVGAVDEPCQATITARPPAVLTEMAQALQSPSLDNMPGRMARLLDLFSAEVQGAAPGAFLPALQKALSETIMADGNPISWQGVVSVLRRHALSCFPSGEPLLRAENLCSQARVMIGEAAQQAQARERLWKTRQDGVLRDIGEALLTAFDMDSLTAVLVEDLPRLDIKRAYLSLYEEPEAPAEWSRLILAYDDGRSIQLESGAERFPSSELVPAGLLPQETRHSLVVEALHFREEQFGLAVFEVGPWDGGVYEGLREQISSALKGLFLLQARGQAEDALRQSNAELQARNEELDAFTHTVAHDLQNPLAIIIGTAEALEEQCTLLPAEELRTHLQMIAQSGRNLDSIIDELLLLAQVRMVEVRKQPLDMDKIMTDVLRRLSNLIGETRTQILAPDTWPQALGYGPWVEQVWVNYLSNAIKYGGQPPRVELGAEYEPARGGERGQIRFWVHDNGPGLTPERQARLFTPFTRLDQIHVKGYGLGLSIVRRIVENLGGQVKVESEGVPGQGSVFSFTLPAAAGQDAQREAPPRRTSPGSTTSPSAA